MNVISSHLENILNLYTKDSYYEDMKEALSLFQERTGKMDADSAEYESRMHSFNDWFVFNYRKDSGERIVDKYVRDEKLDYELAKALTQTSYSLFLFKKINFRKKIIIKDVIHDLKFALADDCAMLPLVENDLFVGRSVKFREDFYLLPGICLLPRNTLSVLKKEAKRVRKQEDARQEESFLLKIESLKHKSLQYGHIDSVKVFSAEEIAQ